MCVYLSAVVLILPSLFHLYIFSFLFINISIFLHFLYFSSFKDYIAVITFLYYLFHSFFFFSHISLSFRYIFLLTSPFSLFHYSFLSTTLFFLLISLPLSFPFLPLYCYVSVDFNAIRALANHQTGSASHWHPTRLNRQKRDTSTMCKKVTKPSLIPYQVFLYHSTYRITVSNEMRSQLAWNGGTKKSKEK